MACVLCVLLRSLQKNVAFFAFLYVLCKRMRCPTLRVFYTVYFAITTVCFFHSENLTQPIEYCRTFFLINLKLSKFFKTYKFTLVKNYFWFHNDQ